MRARSWERCGETGLVLLGFLTLAVSVGNLSTRGLQFTSERFYDLPSRDSDSQGRSISEFRDHTGTQLISVRR
ncbi:hypothetical protein F2P81_025225 [Scophthalmus maximus]|uniref:Uncharacterized protein n=1 Tax=Scophthalmus maximus TaxID=52904 RepID=A0A6A4RQR3_SCOMX|nr:hypothetical protein F2P81_025225 [Scophthalmus maximus]